jgi:Tfp pilus assembly protein PilE
MATLNKVGQIQAIRGINLSAVVITLVILGILAAVIYTLYISGIPRMFAASLAEYIAIIAQ